MQEKDTHLVATKGSKPHRPSRKTRRRMARLAAVQILYQNRLTDSFTEDLLCDYLNHYAGQSLEEVEYVNPDAEFLQKLVRGSTEYGQILQGILIERHQQHRDFAQQDVLVQSLLIVASYELLYERTYEPAIIISDYLSVAEGFFDQKLIKLINAVLDDLHKNPPHFSDDLPHTEFSNLSADAPPAESAIAVIDSSYDAGCSTGLPPGRKS